MKNTKIIIITMIIISLFIASILILTNYKSDNSKKNQNIQPKQEVVRKETINTEQVTNSAMYFTIKSCVDTYMKYITEQNKEAIYSVLSPNYIQENNISVENVLNYVPKIEGKYIDLSIQDMRVKNDGEMQQTYYIYGIIRNENGDKKEAWITVDVDITNKVFTVEPDVIEGVFNE